MYAPFVHRPKKKLFLAILLLLSHLVLTGWISSAKAAPPSMHLFGIFSNYLFTKKSIKIVQSFA